jgi:hypothetical protein
VVERPQDKHPKVASLTSRIGGGPNGASTVNRIGKDLANIHVFDQVEKSLSSKRVNIPILATLIPDGIKLGTIFVVEFDPESQWFTVATTIAAACITGAHTHTRKRTTNDDDFATH